MADARTIAVYDAKAADYAATFAATAPDESLRDFIALIPKGGRVLDLGCGPGAASAHMKAAGLVPDPVDASAAMVKMAREKFGLDARQGSFDDISGEDVYAGIWANFSLLHATRGDLTRHFQAIGRALRPDGVLHVGMKTGTGAARDALDRRYTYVTVEELRGLLQRGGLVETYVREGTERGLAGTDDPFVIMRAVKHG